MTPLITRPLREEHKELLPHVEELRATADMVGEAPPGELLKAIDACLGFLEEHLLPHAEAEENGLYPAVQRVLGAPETTATMSLDHAEIRRLAGELASLRGEVGVGALTTGRARNLRRVLYGLYALVALHFLKEEEVYLPLLDARLTPAEAEEMFKQMEAAAARARSTHLQPG